MAQESSEVCCMVFAGIFALCGGLCYIISKQSENKRRLEALVEKINSETFRPHGMVANLVRYVQSDGDNNRTVQWLQIDIVYTPPVQASPSQVVTCPTCHTQLGVPPGAPSFQCPTCKTILQSPSTPIMATPVYSSAPPSYGSQPYSPVSPGYSPVQSYSSMAPSTDKMA